MMLCTVGLGSLMHKLTDCMINFEGYCIKQLIAYKTLAWTINSIKYIKVKVKIL